MFRDTLNINLMDNLNVDLHVDGYGVLSVRHIISNIERYRSELAAIGTIEDDDYQSGNILEMDRLSSLLRVHTRALKMYHLFGDGVMGGK